VKAFLDLGVFESITGTRFPYFIPAKTEETDNSNLHGFEVHRPSSKGTKLLFQVITAKKN